MTDRETHKRNLFEALDKGVRIAAQYNSIEPEFILIGSGKLG